MTADLNRWPERVECEANMANHSTSINLSGVEIVAGGNVLEIKDSSATNGRFISVDFTPYVSVILPGFDADAVAAARQMAAKLTELADECESQLVADLAAGFIE